MWCRSMAEGSPHQSCDRAALRFEESSKHLDIQSPHSEIALNAQRVHDGPFHLSRYQLLPARGQPDLFWPSELCPVTALFVRRRFSLPSKPVNRHRSIAPAADRV